MALVFACVNVAAERSKAASISLADVRHAIQVIEWFKYEANRVYGILDEDTEQREARQLVDRLRRKGGAVTARELQQSSRQYRTADDAEVALAELVKAGLGRWEARDGQGWTTHAGIPAE